MTGAQRVAAAPFALLAGLTALAVAGAIAWDAVGRLITGSDTIRGASELIGFAIVATLVLALPAAAIMGDRLGGPSDSMGVPRRPNALRALLVAGVEAAALALPGWIMIGRVGQLTALGDATIEHQIRHAWPQLALGVALLLAAVFVLAAGAARVSRGR